MKTHSKPAFLLRRTFKVIPRDWSCYYWSSVCRACVLESAFFHDATAHAPSGKLAKRLTISGAFVLTIQLVPAPTKTLPKRQKNLLSGLRVVGLCVMLTSAFGGGVTAHPPRIRPRDQVALCVHQISLYTTANSALANSER